MARFMDTLGELSEESSSSEAEDDVPLPKAKKKKALAEPAPEELEHLGYRSGPSILFVPEPKAEPGSSNWEWGQGDADKAAEVEEESRAERERTREAAGSGLEDAARLMRKAQQQALELKEQAREEQRKLAHERRLTFKQKEKRKRDLGMQGGGRNYIEEEKRVARNFGFYSGFDT
ncbi:hypothetical protein WJX81_003134 [Elliptochloris bilobata]|uniref:Uncharacterized protein n=1 Tax=Elliptochloris bilobata TaxID=381761 RepID=A0AAW1QLI9_9CHLO